MIERIVDERHGSQGENDVEAVGGRRNMGSMPRGEWTVPDERSVSVDIDGNEWFGFVNIRWLRHKVEQGDDEVLVKVVRVAENTFTGRMPGNAIEKSFFEGQLAKAIPNDNLQAGHSGSP